MTAPDYLQDPAPLLQTVISLCEEAGEMIMAVYNTDFAVQEKQDSSPLTAADLAAHETLLAGLEELLPEIPVLSEESADIPFSVRQQWLYYWLIDPLDGTREFVKRNGEFTVNVALIYQHQPILGVILAPVTGVTYYAARGHGAFKIEPGQSPVSISSRPISPVITVAGSRSHASDSLKTFLENIGEHELLPMGSSLKSCLVAEGRADIYPRLGPTSEWDTAAAQAIVEEAGGKLTDTELHPLRYNTKDSLLNPDFLAYGDSSIDWLQYLRKN